MRLDYYHCRILDEPPMPNTLALRTVLFCLFVVFMTSLWLAWQPIMGWSASLFLLAAAIVQSCLLCSPLLVLYALQRACATRGISTRWLVLLMQIVCVAIILFMFANYKLRDMYGFYVNFFVINLLVTPGGVEAMGVSSSTNRTLALAVLALTVFIYFVLRYVPFERAYPKAIKRRHLYTGFIVLMLAQSACYAYSEYHYNRVILGTADRIVWYVPVTARSFFEGMGVTIDRPNSVKFDTYESGGSLSYPATPDLAFSEPYNIVWLVSESLRADMLGPEIMPNTWQFAKHSQRFNQHYSGGNGTRMGMFSQFYGLYGGYWFDFLYAHRAPLMVDLIKKNNYTMKAYTSSRFSYPEFDKTIFADLKEEQLQSFTEGEGWERDRKNVADMLQFIDSSTSPFFSFMFFESAHANYYFPPESVIREDYIDDFNYLTVDVEEQIERIRNRYINATHHLDSQLGRVFEKLEEKKLLDNTIVIVTGDHGEEFMEKGRWGHNSTFSQEQIQVPLLIYIPGAGAGETDVMTSHHDIPATILSALGVDIDPQTYSFGQDLLNANYRRDYAVVSDWHGNTLVTPDVKMVFSKKGAMYNNDIVTTLNDTPIDLVKSQAVYKVPLGEFAREISRFYH